MVKYYIFIAILVVVVVGIVVVGFIIVGDPISQRDKMLGNAIDYRNLYTVPTQTPTPVPTQTPNSLTSTYTKGITNGSFDNGLKGWTVTTDGNAEAVMDNGRLKLRVYKCSSSDALQTFQVNSNKLSFDWQTRADENWYEPASWSLLAGEDLIERDVFNISHSDSDSGRKEIDTSKYIGKTATLHFKITPSKYCQNSDHNNTYLWIDNVL